MADVGNGASITFGTSGFTGSLMSIDGNEITREPVETSHLGTTTAKTFIPDDLYDAGELSVTFQYDPDEQPPFAGAAETITITFPVPSGLNNGATCAGTGFVTSFKQPELSVGELMEAEMTIKFSGALTFVDAS